MRRASIGADVFGPATCLKAGWRRLNADTPRSPLPVSVVLDDHVAQSRADAPADPPGIVMAVLDLALDAALILGAGPKAGEMMAFRGAD
jgi:hypothetical protein